MLDGAECALGTNPASAANKPTAAGCAGYLGVGASVDTDGDRLFDRIEFCNYNTDRLLLDTDGDQDATPLNANPAVNLIKDGCEAASLSSEASQVELIRRIQFVEMHLLLRASFEDATQP